MLKRALNLALVLQVVQNIAHDYYLSVDQVSRPDESKFKKEIFENVPSQVPMLIMTWQN